MHFSESSQLLLSRGQTLLHSGGRTLLVPSPARFFVLWCMVCALYCRHRLRDGNAPLDMIDSAHPLGYLCLAHLLGYTYVLYGCCQAHSVSALREAACPTCAFQPRRIAVSWVVRLSAPSSTAAVLLTQPQQDGFLLTVFVLCVYVAGICPEGMGRQGRQCCSRPSCFPGTCGCQQCGCKGHPGSTSQQLNLLETALGIEASLQALLFNTYM